LDQTTYGKFVDQLVSLLKVLDCEGRFAGTRQARVIALYESLGTFQVPVRSPFDGAQGERNSGSPCYLLPSRLVFGHLLFLLFYSATALLFLRERFVESRGRQTRQTI
jgi:hypothetical protein